MGLPGQRAAQSPQRAAIASARAMGRAVADGGALCPVVGMRVNGVRWEQRIGPDGSEERVRAQLPAEGGPVGDVGWIVVGED